MALNVVLFEPEIPNNTGNIGRLCLATGSNLHLVKPFGFEITDSRLKRAGLDYWKFISIFMYDSIDDFYNKNLNKKMVYFSSHAKKAYDSIDYRDEIFLIFGKESIGLSKKIIDTNFGETYKIPIYNNRVRSLNLSNSVSIVIYEALKYV
tara:strand:+ start:201 stop:650 length:450 start_codon:yes stop_codon:yes gene_type:complete